MSTASRWANVLGPGAVTGYHGGYTFVAVVYHYLQIVVRVGFVYPNQATSLENVKGRTERRVTTRYAHSTSRRSSPAVEHNPLRSIKKLRLKHKVYFSIFRLQVQRTKWVYLREVYLREELFLELLDLPLPSEECLLLLPLALLAEVAAETAAW